MSKSPKLPSDKELRDLGRNIVAIYESGYTNRKAALKFAFWKGLVTGFAAFLGGTIVIALLAWFLSLFDQVPFIDKILDSLQN